MSTKKKTEPKKDSQLVLAGTVAPKPTKAEIISAMAQIETARLTKEWEASKIRHAETEKELEEEVSSLVVENIESLKPEANLGGVYSEGRLLYVGAKFELTGLPPQLAKKLRAFHKEYIPYSAPNFTDVRKKVHNKMLGFTSPSERIETLVNNPESRAALETMLDEINKAEKKAVE